MFSVEEQFTLVHETGWAILSYNTELPQRHFQRMCVKPPRCPQGPGILHAEQGYPQPADIVGFRENYNSGVLEKAQNSPKADLGAKADLGDRSGS